MILVFSDRIECFVNSIIPDKTIENNMYVKRTFKYCLADVREKYIPHIMKGRIVLTIFCKNKGKYIIANNDINDAIIAVINILTFFIVNLLKTKLRYKTNAFINELYNKSKSK